MKAQAYLYHNDYAGKYRLAYGKIPNNFNIHHLDGDRTNNQLKNLVAVPIELHEKYHNLEIELLALKTHYNHFTYDEKISYQQKKVEYYKTYGTILLFALNKNHLKKGELPYKKCCKPI